MTSSTQPLVDSSITVDVSDYLALRDQVIPAREQCNYEVSRDNLRHIAYAFEDYNALWMDEDFARGTRWAGIIAMPGYLYAHGVTQDLRLRGRIVDSTGALYDKADNMGDEWDFILPVRPGDAILSTHRVVDAVVKRGPRMGLFALVSSESTYRNQLGQIVATVRGITSRWSGARQNQLGRLASVYDRLGLKPQKTELDEGDPLYLGIPFGQLPPRYPARRYDHHNVYFEDVIEGEQLPDYSFRLTHYGLTRMSAHLHNSASSSAGSTLVTEGFVPTRYSGGTNQIIWFGAALMKWAGPNAWVQKLSYRAREWMLVDHPFVVKGEVARKYVEDNKQYVQCDLRIEHATAGFICGTSQAVVELLSRNAKV